MSFVGLPFKIGHFDVRLRLRLRIELRLRIRGPSDALVGSWVIRGIDISDAVEIVILFVEVVTDEELFALILRVDFHGRIFGHKRGKHQGSIVANYWIESVSSASRL